MSDSEKNLNPLANIVNKIKSNKKIQYCLIAITFIIVALLFFAGFNEQNETKIETKDVVSEYIDDLETRLSSILSKVKGAGKVSVIITVESGMETVLAMQTTINETASSTETVSTPLIVNGKTVIVKELYPPIVGVLIVAEGAGNISVLNKIQQATVSLLSIDLKQIEILSMK